MLKTHFEGEYATHDGGICMFLQDQKQFKSYFNSCTLPLFKQQIAVSERTGNACGLYIALKTAPEEKKKKRGDFSSNSECIWRNQGLLMHIQLEEKGQTHYTDACCRFLALPCSIAGGSAVRDACCRLLSSVGPLRPQSRWAAVACPWQSIAQVVALMML